MKRNIHFITIIAIIFTILSLFVKKQENHLNLFSSRETGNGLKTDSESQNILTFPNTVSCKNENTQELYFDENKHTGKIGMTDSTLFDNPKDNVFNINIDKDITENTTAYLEYDLYGVQDFNSVCRGINDNISVGGVFVKKSNIWSSQSEEIPASQLKKGVNKIRFSIQPENDYGYIVRNVRLRFETENNTERQLIINQPTGRHYYSQYGYIAGFVAGKGAEKAKIYANGTLLKTYNSQFEGIIKKKEDNSQSWFSEISAVFEDGQTISTKVVFDLPNEYDFKCSYQAVVPYCETFVSNCSDLQLSINGFSLEGEAASLENDQKLTVTGLRTQDMPLLNSDMLNVTAENSGYRCLPHGSKFLKNLKIRIKYDTARIPKGYGPKDIRTFYYDENTSKWIMLPLDTIDLNRHEIVSYTNHFTDFVNSILKTPEAPLTQAFTPTSMKDYNYADPMAGYNIMGAPSANNEGTANMSFPLELPKGRQGMEPQLAITYNSDGGDGWLGVGWNLNISTITVDTRWGVPHYFPDKESESYLLNGEQLLPLVQRADFVARSNGDKVFTPRVEGAFDKIIRHGTLPSNYWWEIIDKHGVKYIYGKYNQDNTPNPSCVLTDNNGNIARWALADVRDLNDNFVKYNYTIITYNSAPGAGGKQIYPQSIEYTGLGNIDGKYTVNFEIDSLTRPDYSVSARSGFIEVNVHLLNAIGIFYDNQFVRGYIIKYKTGAYNKKLICTITDVADEYLWDTRKLNNGDNCEGVSVNTFDQLRPKVHRFDYFTIVEQSFAEPVTITNGDGGEGLWILDGAVNLSNTPALSKSLTTGWSLGGSLNIGLGAKFYKKNNSLGGSYTYNASKTKDYLMFIDINGDGLPDRLFKRDGDIYFKKLYFDNNQLVYGNEVRISGLPALGKSNNYANTWGIEGQLSILAASASWTKTHNYNSSYFADVNADGYPDYIDDGSVYYNAINNLQNPYFIKETDGINQEIPGSPCNFIIRSGEVNDSVYTQDSKRGDKTYSRDVVRVWVAPYNGTITINSSVRLIEDTSYSRKQSHLVDGVLYSVQHSASELERENINASDYNTHNWSQDSIEVTKGDKIYFRLQSKADRKWDDVMWNPTIIYNKINNTIIDTNIVDANGKKTALFRPSNDLLINDKQIFQAPYSGKVRIKGTLTINNVSDTVFFRIKKGNSIIHQSSFANNSSVNYYLNDTLSVTEGESINFIAYTNTNIDWNKISNDFKIYYYKADSVVIDTNSAFNKIEVRPMFQYNIHQNTIQYSGVYDLDSGNYTINPIITASPQMTGTVLLAVKKNNQVLGKKLISIVNGNVVGNPVISINNPSNGNIYFEYYCDSLSNYITLARVRLNFDWFSIILNAELHAFMPDSMIIFGNLYRGWGQFSYKDNSDTNNSQPINESYLHLSNLSQDTTLITFDTSGMNNYSAASSELSANGENDPLNEHFNMMFPDLDSMVYRDYARESYLSKYKVSTSVIIVQPHSTSQDTVYDSPLIIQTNPSVPVRSIRKSLIEKNFAYSISISLGLSLSYSHNNTSSRSDMDYMDLNGDRYPDIVGTENVQYTTPQGGFFDNINENVLTGSLENSEYEGDGSSYGVNLPFATSSNAPLHSTNSAPSSKYFKTVVEKGGILAIGFSPYEGNSHSSYALNDINGDGLPDKIHNSGEICLNYGYRFGDAENWGISDFNKDFCTSDSYSLGGGSYTNFNNSQYSWSGGISLSLSETKKSLALADMNNDGFLDIVRVDSPLDPLVIILNNGHGFSTTTTWSNPNAFTEGNSTSGSAYLAGSAGITFSGIIKIVINLQGSLSGSVNYQKIILTDFNNDGYPDIVSMDDDNNVVVRYSNMGKINMLKKVTTPTHSSYTVDYTLSTCDQDMPQRRWLMTSLKIFDGFNGDGQDTLYQKFDYAHGYYDRFDRTFWGFDSVITMQYNNFTPSGSCYRSSIEKYYNRDFLFKGLKNYDVTLAGTTTKFIETYYKYDKKEISSGKVIPADSVQCFGPYFPAISQEDKYFYEGQTNYSIHTQIKYTHGKYGNIIKFDNIGDTEINDDVLTTISYSYDTIKNLLAMVDSISVRDANNTLLRKRIGTYNNNGQITQIGVTDGSNFSYTDIRYDSCGNIEKIQLPKNSSGHRMYYKYQYDSILRTYPVIVADSMGYYSQSTYDYRLGLPLTLTDITGNKINYTYYPDGKPKTITGPKELASGAPYTLKFIYSDQNYLPVSTCSKPLFAITYHFDSLNQGNNFVTFTMVDGLDRVIETKQKVTISGNDSLLVSGKKDYDAYGRVIKTYIPITEDIIQSASCQYPYDTIPFYYNYIQPYFSTTTYDVLDRPIVDTATDQTTVNYAYDFGDDAFSVKRFMTTITDPNGISSTIFTSPQGLKTSVTNPLNTITKFAYNMVGELEKSTDPEGNETSYEYDLLGRLKQRNHPDAGRTKYEYDAAGNLLSTITENLDQLSEEIRYMYDYNRLIRVHYPQNPENDVFYNYGEPSDSNQAGKIILMQDASGTQKFKYGNMGELIQNIHTFVVPDGKLYTFEMDWEYDSWNRTKKITYPDGEIVQYAYNNGGQLKKMTGTKGMDSYQYIDSLKYNMFGNRNEIFYGNGTYSEYLYNPLNQLLTNLKSYNIDGDLMQNISYTYDNSKNITAIYNEGIYISNMGGIYSYNYVYDDLYRLTEAEGEFNSYDYGNIQFGLGMNYSPSGNITYKTLGAQTLINGSLQTISYDNNYSYNNRPHSVTKAGDFVYEWDLNGNMKFRENSGNQRNLCWDEENRLTTVRDFDKNQSYNLSSYIYNATGERTWKLTGEDQLMWINGHTEVHMVNFNKTLYSSPFMVMNEKEYTKHYFIEGERICSKLGSGFSLVNNPEENHVPAIEGSVNDIPENLWEMVLRGVECTQYEPKYVFIDRELKPAENTQYENEKEKDQFFYHPDHLGSSSFITDAGGNAIQHLQYLPFGETFVDQQNGSYDTPYKFSGKEKDDETQYSYFGARYYDSDLSIWLSVDPLSDKYPSLSPYAYCAGNPVLLVDKDGKDIWVGFEATHDGNSGHTTITYTTYKQVQVNVNGVMTTMYQQDGFAITEQNQYNSQVNTAMGDYQNWESRSPSSLEINRFQYLSSKQDSRIKINTATGTEIDGTTYYTQEQIQNELNLQKYAQNKEDNNIGKETFILESNNCTDYAVEVLRTLGIKTGGNEKTLIEHKSGKTANISNPNALFKWMNSQITHGKKPLWKVEKASDAIKEDPKPTMQNY